MSQLVSNIENLIAQAEALKKGMGYNPKYLNKCIARLDEARLLAREAGPSGQVDGVSPNGQYAPGARVVFPKSPEDGSGRCICPAGTMDTVSCPVHRLSRPMSG